MSSIRVVGPAVLRGELVVPGAKNSISKLLTASMLTGEPCTFTNVPRVSEVEITCEICRSAGMELSRDGARRLTVSTPSIASSVVPADLARRNRLSVMMLGPLLNRAGRASIAAAGGDRIGIRPVGFHLEAFSRMGARIRNDGDAYLAETDGLRGADLTLPYPSVTATENLLMGASLAKGRTYIRNAAIEPEVLDLVLFLQKMGAIIDYKVDRTFVIEGVATLGGATHDVMPDRLVAASFAVAAVASGGDLLVRGARQADMLTFLNTLRRVGGCFEVREEGIRFYRGASPLKPIALETTVHPGFMTDWHPPFAVLLTQAEGMSVIHETVFEDRLTYAAQLRKMGADIEVYDRCLGEGTCRFATTGHRHSAVIRGPVRLRGAEMTVTDLRAGFTHLLAAVIADGESTIHGVEELDRGYEAVDEAFSSAGASIERT